MIYLILFIGGILFDEFFIPLLNSFTEWMQLIIEKRKGILALKIAKMNKEINETAKDQEDGPLTYAIGFQMPDSEEDLEEDDDF